MTSPNDEAGSGESSGSTSSRVDRKDQWDSLSSSVNEIKEMLDRLTKSVGDLNSKLQSTSDVLKWVLNTLSQRSEEKETLYLKNIQASTELLKSFVDFLESKLGSFGEVPPKPKEAKPSRKETPTKEVHPAASKEEGEFMVKPSLVKRLQEEQGKEKDKKSR